MAAVSKHEGPVLILRDARTLVPILRDLFGARAPQDEDDRARGSSPNRFGHSHLVPATRLRPGLAIYFAHPESKGGRSAEGRILYRCRAGKGASRVCKTRRASCEACLTRSPLGAPPRRFLATSPLRLRIISGNALNERGFCLSSTDALRSQ